IHIYENPIERDIPQRDFVFGQDYIRGFVSALVAPGGAGKSSLTITESLSMAAGVRLLDAQPKSAQNVALWNLEDDIDEMNRRIKACAKFSADALKGTGWENRLFVNSASEKLKIGRALRGVAELDMPIIKGLIRSLLASAIDVLTVDPFVSSHGV